MLMMAVRTELFNTLYTLHTHLCCISTWGRGSLPAVCQVVSVSFNRGNRGQSGPVQPVLVPSLTRTEGLWGSGLQGRGVSEGGPAVSLSGLTSMRLLIEMIAHKQTYVNTFECNGHRQQVSAQVMTSLCLYSSFISGTFLSFSSKFWLTWSMA